MTYKILTVSTSFVILTSVSSSCFHSSNVKKVANYTSARGTTRRNRRDDDPMRNKNNSATLKLSAPHIQEDIPLDMNERFIVD